MGAIVNGINVHGGMRGYGATFLTFSDYMRGAVRLGALMGAPSIWVYTHDSIFLGEDGPTHQSVEHVAALRAIPELWVIRPGNAAEVAGAWEVALNRVEGPTALILSRQGLPVGGSDPVPVDQGRIRGRDGLRRGSRRDRLGTGDCARRGRDPRGRGHIGQGRFDALPGSVPEPRMTLPGECPR